MIARQPADAGSAARGDSLSAVGQLLTQAPTELVEHCISAAKELLEEAPDHPGVARLAPSLETFVTHCDDYLEARHEGSGFLLRYTLICAQSCDLIATRCRKIDHPDAPQLERFCRVCEKFLDREFRASLENRRSCPELAAGMRMEEAC